MPGRHVAAHTPVILPPASVGAAPAAPHPRRHCRAGWAGACRSALFASRLRLGSESCVRGGRATLSACPLKIFRRYPVWPGLRRPGHCRSGATCGELLGGLISAQCWSTVTLWSQGTPARTVIWVVSCRPVWRGGSAQCWSTVTLWDQGTPARRLSRVASCGRLSEGQQDK